MNKRALARALAKQPAHFLNVDLDIYSMRPLDVLAQAMETVGAIALHCDRFDRDAFVGLNWPAEFGYRASFEVEKCRFDADGTIQELGRIVARLPAPARRLFDRAKRREFSIGIQSAKEPNSFEVPVSREALAIVTSLKGQLSVTVYSPFTAKKLVAPKPTQAKGRRTS